MQLLLFCFTVRDLYPEKLDEMLITFRIWQIKHGQSGLDQQTLSLLAYIKNKNYETESEPQNHESEYKTEFLKSGFRVRTQTRVFPILAKLQQPVFFFPNVDFDILFFKQLFVKKKQKNLKIFNFKNY